MATLIGNERPSPRSLRTMRRRGGTWAAYQNQTFSHEQYGSLRFLRVGLSDMYQHPPPHFPATRDGGPGTEWVPVGYVDLDSGLVKWERPV